MALSKTITTIKGYDSLDGYFTVEDIILNDCIMTFTVKCKIESENLFFDAAKYSIPIKKDDDVDSKDAYEYLKTLPEFKDSEDC